MAPRSLWLLRLLFGQLGRVIKAPEYCPDSHKAEQANEQERQTNDDNQGNNTEIRQHQVAELTPYD